MDIIKGSENIRHEYKNPVVTLGNFDGVHIGHKKIFKGVTDRAKEIEGTSVVITFDPHPVRVVAPGKGLKILTPFEDKAELISKMGIDVILCIHFTLEFASLSPDDFINDIIVNKIKARHVLVGHNYRFGKGKGGTTELLRRRGIKHGFGFNVVRNVKRGGFSVSSSRIRESILNGDVRGAAFLLGCPYFIKGRVISGAGRGSKVLDTPTANIATENEIIPKIGVYAVRVVLDGKVYDGVGNIGRNPTFGDNDFSYEVHLFDFNRDIGEKDIKIYFIERLRDEKVFSSADDLKAQIERDIGVAKEILRGI